MLDDINSELLSIYPGTFPNPRSFSRNPLVFNSGFHAYIRPPLPLYRIQCINDYIAEKSKKAEAAIRKLYKAAATSSSATFKEGNALFKHDLSPESMLTKYRETQIYSKSRLRKVNRRQLYKAIALAKNKEEEESKRQYDLTVSKIDLQSPSSKHNLKQKLEPKLRKSKNRSSSAAEDNEKALKSESDIGVTKPSSCANSDARADTVLSKPKGPLTLRRPMTLKKSHEPTQKRKAEIIKNGISISIPECLLKEEDGEGRKPMKDGNYTKIVTFKRKALFKSATSVEINSFPFTDQVLGRFSGALQKVTEQKEGGPNNQIDHLYKINELETSLTPIPCSRRRNAGSTNRVTCSDSTLEQIAMKMEQSPEQSLDWSTAKLMEKNQLKNDLLSKYGVSQTLTKAPYGLQLKEIPLKIPVIEGQDHQKADSGRIRPRKHSKREEKYLFLPKVTPLLGADPLKMAKDRKNTMRLRMETKKRPHS